MSVKPEKPKQEMQRIIRGIAGKAVSGEREPQLRSKALRRMNAGLKGEDQLSDRQVRSYWHEETETIPSQHMDRARQLANVQPIEEAINAIDRAESFIVQQLEALRSKRNLLSGLADRHANLIDPESNKAAAHHDQSTAKGVVFPNHSDRTVET